MTAAKAWLASREGKLGLLSMTMLVFQGTALSLVLRYSRTRPGTPYLASVAVVLTEVIKLGLCGLAHAVSSAKAASSRSAAAEVRHQMKEVLGKSPPMAVPAALFVAQQLLVIVAASNLDAVTFQICAQSFKIVPTAIFAVWLLGQMLEPHQWASLPVLAMGTVFVTLNGGARAAPGGAAAVAAAATVAGTDTNLALGLAASCLSGLSSAYAGVHFEKFVKGRLSQSLWVRNLQLSVYGAPLALLYALARDGPAIRAGGWLQGFDRMAWGVVGLQVFGGLIVGLVVKYADNILKNFANALSVVLTVLGAIPLFGQWPSAWFLVGIACVLLSVSMYSGAGPAPPPALAAAAVEWWRARPGVRRFAGDVVLALGLTRGGGGTHEHAPAGAARRAARLRVAAVAVVAVLLLAGAGAAGVFGGVDAAAANTALGRRGMPGARVGAARPGVVPGDADGDAWAAAGGGGRGGRHRATVAGDEEPLSRRRTAAAEAMHEDGGVVGRLGATLGVSGWRQGTAASGSLVPTEPPPPSSGDRSDSLPSAPAVSRLHAAAPTAGLAGTAAGLARRVAAAARLQAGQRLLP